MPASRTLPIALGCFAILWGLWMLVPWVDRSAYTPVVTLGAEGLLVVSGVSLVSGASLAACTLRSVRRGVRLASACLCALWSFLSALWVVVEPASAACVVYLWLAMCAGWSHIEARSRP